MRQMSHPRRNIELKARLADFDRTRRIAQDLATEVVGVEHQIDTYFSCRTGRLKLRERGNLPAQLISYTRANEAESKPSDYRLVEVPNPTQLKEALAMALGIETVVTKVREIFIFENVRIHLDQVEERGEFIEFEAVLGSESSEAVQYDKIQTLCQRFGIQAADYVKGSYGAENASPH
jgi:adenylate cyclase class 2